MILLFEEYNYPVSTLRDVLSEYGYMCTELKGDKAKVQYVGYFYSKAKEDSVFILPKVFVSENEKAFNRYNPVDIVYVDKLKKVESLSDNSAGEILQSDYSIIFELSVWIYRAIAQFVKRNENNGIVDDVLIQNPIDANGERTQTLIDIVLQLLDFHKNHHHLFTYIAIINSSGNNKIHWPKTISKTQPILQDNTPYYVNFRNKNKVINFDEELIVLFYSTLKYLSEKYNIKVKADVQYTLLSPRKIEDLISTKRGTRLLKKIRKKYFADEFIKLWNLLYTFFDMAENINSRKYHNDKLLTKNFNVVFEDMVDYLISDDRNDVPKELYEQQDGKIVDHIYKDKSLLNVDNDIYYVGDSKYYKETTHYSKNSIYKQFTYAKNVIQYNINVFNNKGDARNCRYRDELTEGYDITPNFFVMGVVDFDKLDNKDACIKNLGETLDNQHFENRLFDRDTLFLQKYSINFLYLLSIYVAKLDSRAKASFRKQIREDFIRFIEGKFDFYLLESITASLKENINKHFRNLIGKIYKSNNAIDLVVMALHKNSKENKSILNEIDKDFFRMDCVLSRDFKENAIPLVVEDDTIPFVAEGNVHQLDLTPMESVVADYGDEISYDVKDTSYPSILLGVYKDNDHLTWILDKKKYNVRLGERKGAVEDYVKFLSVKYLVLYNLNDVTEYKIYKLEKGHEQFSGEEMKEIGYPITDCANKKYLIYNLGDVTDEISVADIEALLSYKKNEEYKNSKRQIPFGAPIYVRESELSITNSNA